MQLIPCSETAEEGAYRVLFHSENRVWFLGTKPVLFGTRVIAWKAGSVGPSIDYCAGADSIFMVQLLMTVAEIFKKFPEGITESELEKQMPRWSVRPINDDPCWSELQAMALTVA